MKCKYKDFLKPAKQAELDSTRRNVREEIRETIRKQIREAAPELGNSLSEILHIHTVTLRNQRDPYINLHR